MVPASVPAMTYLYGEPQAVSRNKAFHPMLVLVMLFYHNNRNLRH